jgi:hypothetical protein
MTILTLQVKLMSCDLRTVNNFSERLTTRKSKVV